MLMIEYKDIAWWYWLLTAILLTIGILGNDWGFMLATGLTSFQLVHYIFRAGNLKDFPVQVRFWYLILLLVSLPESMQWLYWVPCIGTWAQVIFGYCAMARMVSLWPWNREEAFSFSLLNKTFLSRPVRGSVQQGFSGYKED
jgi:CDP-diglyceride synthetase